MNLPDREDRQGQTSSTLLSSGRATVACLLQLRPARVLCRYSDSHLADSNLADTRAVNAGTKQRDVAYEEHPNPKQKTWQSPVCAKLIGQDQQSRKVLRRSQLSTTPSPDGLLLTVCSRRSGSLLCSDHKRDLLPSRPRFIGREEPLRAQDRDLELDNSRRSFTRNVGAGLRCRLRRRTRLKQMF